MKYLTTFLLTVSSALIYGQQKLIKVNQSNNDPEEVSIAINPLNPLQIAASSNISNYYFSLDGGNKWKEKVMKSKFGVWGDPMVHFDKDGNLYYANLGKNPEKQFPKWIDKMVVHRISLTYDSCYEDKAIGFNNSKIQDKEWLSSDLYGNLYFSWTEFDNYKSKKPNDHSRIRFSRSEDRAHTWATPIVVSDIEGDCLDGDSTMEGATTCSDSKGNIYISWSGLNKIWFDKSNDGGKTFGTDKAITTQTEGWDMNVTHIFRANGMPFLVCDNGNSKFKNRIYVNWCDTRNGDPDVFIKYSDDGGENWSADIRVTTDELKNGAEQFSNNICVDASTGNVYIVFYDKRNSTSSAYIDVYVACSKDGGNSWENIRITPKPFPAPGKETFFGDYLDIDAVNGKVMPIFTASEFKKLNIYTTTLNATSDKNFKEINSLQAVVLSDSLYIHVIAPINKKYKLTILANGIKKEFTGVSSKEEFECVFNARGFSEAKVSLDCGLKKKTVKVKNTKY